MVAVYIIVFQIYMGHVEIRAYILPRLLIFLISWYLCSKYLSVINSFFVTFIMWTIMIVGVNVIVDMQNDSVYCHLLSEKINYIYFQENYMSANNIEFNISLNKNNANTTCLNDGISFGEKIQSLQNMIDNNQKIIDLDIKNR